MAKIQLRYIAQARSGDKANNSDISLFARTPEMYEVFKREVTALRVKEHFKDLVFGPVIRYEVPSVLAFKFVLYNALGGGAAASLRSDNLGKSFGSNLLRLEIEVPDHLLNEANLLVPPFSN